MQKAYIIKKIIVKSNVYFLITIKDVKENNLERGL